MVAAIRACSTSDKERAANGSKALPNADPACSGAAVSAYSSGTGRAVSFRGKLLVFFTIIVIVPMVAVALVLFSLTKGSETGKADARIAQGLRTALTAYDDARGDARPALRQVVADRQLRRKLATGRAAGRRIQALAGSDSIESIVLYDARDRAVAR